MTKLDPFGRKGIFVGYSDTSKAYLIYFQIFKNIDISRYVTFDEDSTYFRSRRTPAIWEVKEFEETRGRDMEIEEEIQENHEDHEMTEPQEPIETFLEKDSHKRNLAWARELLWEVERYGTLEGLHRERKRENPYNSSMALLCHIIDKEPSTYEEPT